MNFKTDPHMGNVSLESASLASDKFLNGITYYLSGIWSWRSVWMINKEDPGSWIKRLCDEAFGWLRVWKIKELDD